MTEHKTDVEARSAWGEECLMVSGEQIVKLENHVDALADSVFKRDVGIKNEESALGIAGGRGAILAIVGNKVVPHLLKIISVDVAVFLGENVEIALCAAAQRAARYKLATLADGSVVVAKYAAPSAADIRAVALALEWHCGNVALHANVHVTHQVDACRATDSVGDAVEDGFFRWGGILIGKTCTMAKLIAKMEHHAA